MDESTISEDLFLEMGFKVVWEPMTHKRIWNKKKNFKRQNRKSTIIPNGIKTTDKSYNSAASTVSINNHWNAWSICCYYPYFIDIDA